MEEEYVELGRCRRGPRRDARQSARHRDRARRVIDAPVVCVNISRRRAHAEDPAWREDRLDFETLDPGVASVLKTGTNAALDLDLDTFVRSEERRVGKELCQCV